MEKYKQYKTVLSYHFFYSDFQIHNNAKMLRKINKWYWLNGYCGRMCVYIKCKRIEQSSFFQVNKLIGFLTRNMYNFD